MQTFYTSFTGTHETPVKPLAGNSRFPDTHISYMFGIKKRQVSVEHICLFLEFYIIF